MRGPLWPGQILNLTTWALKGRIGAWKPFKFLNGVFGQISLPKAATGLFDPFTAGFGLDLDPGFWLFGKKRWGVCPGA
jgi:hypothetical protein